MSLLKYERRPHNLHNLACQGLNVKIKDFSSYYQMSQGDEEHLIYFGFYSFKSLTVLLRRILELVGWPNKSCFRNYAHLLKVSPR